MDQACRWVIKYFSFLLGNAVPNDDIIVTSVKMPFTSQQQLVSGVIICHLVCRLANIFNIIFSHALSKVQINTTNDFFLCNCSLSLNIYNIGLQCNLGFLSITVLQGSVAMWVNDGRIFKDFFIANFLLSVMVKEFWRSVKWHHFSGHGVYVRLAFACVPRGASWQGRGLGPLCYFGCPIAPVFFREVGSIQPPCWLQHQNMTQNVPKLTILMPKYKKNSGEGHDSSPGPTWVPHAQPPRPPACTFLTTRTLVYQHTSSL